MALHKFSTNASTTVFCFGQAPRIQSDTVQLAGREVIQEAMAGEFANAQQFAAAFLVGCDGDQRLVELIVHGENYSGMSQAAAAWESFASSQELENGL